MEWTTKMILSGGSRQRLQLQLGDLPDSTEQENYNLRQMFSFTLKKWGLGTVSDNCASSCHHMRLIGYKNGLIEISKTLRLKRQHTSSAVTETDRYSGSYTTQNFTAAQRGKQMYPVMNPLHPVKAKATCSRKMKAHVIDQIESSPKDELHLLTLKLFLTCNCKTF